ncbi:MAG: hypothetical protein WA706_20070, partial [Pseudolabrys sp.]
PRLLPYSAARIRATKLWSRKFLVRAAAPEFTCSNRAIFAARVVTDQMLGFAYRNHDLPLITVRRQHDEPVVAGTNSSTRYWSG